MGQYGPDFDPPPPEWVLAGRAKRAAFRADTVSRDARLPIATESIKRIIRALEAHGEVLGLSSVLRWSDYDQAEDYGPYAEVRLHRGLSIDEPAFIFRIYARFMVTEIFINGKVKEDPGEVYICSCGQDGLTDDQLVDLWELFKKKRQNNWSGMPERARPILVAI